MTVRKIIELIELVKNKIGNENYISKLQDYQSTIQNNSSNIVLLKELLEKSIFDIEDLMEESVPELLNKLLVGKIVPFEFEKYHKQLIGLMEKNHSDYSTLYNELTSIFSQMIEKITQNLTEIENIKKVINPFQTKDFEELQAEDNAIFAIIFNNENSFNNLKSLSFELKNWDRGLFLYQQIISDETPKAFEIIEVEQGSVEVVINLVFDVAEKLVDLFKTGLETYGAYLAYKTLIHEKLFDTFKGNKELILLEEKREKLLLENVKKSVKEEIKKQIKKGKKQEAIDKKIDEVTRLITDHIIKGNTVKLLSAPEEKEEIIEKEKEKEKLFIKSKIDYKKLDAITKQLLLEEFTTLPPEENYEKE
jgi:hypothetical protein